MIRSRDKDGNTIDWRYYHGVGYEKNISQERINRIRQLKEENPDANHKWLAVMAFDSEHTVGVALRS